MKLLDLLSITNENTTVNIISCAKVIARYDGKDSIQKELNEYEVLQICVENDELFIEISE